MYHVRFWIWFHVALIIKPTSCHILLACFFAEAFYPFFERTRSVIRIILTNNLIHLSGFIFDIKITTFRTVPLKIFNTNMIQEIKCSYNSRTYFKMRKKLIIYKMLPWLPDGWIYFTFNICVSILKVIVQKWVLTILTFQAS